MTTTLQSASLHFREGNSDKVYHAAIEPSPGTPEGYLVTFAYGRRGNTLNTGTKTTHPVSLAEATKVFDKLVASKLAKGYHYSFASAGETKPYQQTGDEGRDSGIRCQLLNAVEHTELPRLFTGRTHCLQEKHGGRRLMVRKQGDEITGINRRGLVVAIPDPIREAVEHIPFDVLIDGETVGDTLHAFDLLEVKGNDIRKRSYLDRFTSLMMVIPSGLDALRWVSTAVDPDDKLETGSIQSTSVYPTLDAKDFPERPESMGDVTVVPPSTLQGLAGIAGCASTETTRQILNGVLFTPEDGGRLIATDGKRLACYTAAVPSQEFVLPIAACHILGHPDFTADLATITWIDHKEEEKRRVAIKCGRHQLVSKPLVGSYPGYKQVIPAHAQELAVIPHDRKPGLIAWLRSLGKAQCSVRLDWRKRGQQSGQLTLSHREPDGRSATMQVPVEIHGSPPVIAFNARYLAVALEIGGTLCLSDELSPGICRHPTGRFCVIMPMRVTIPTGTHAAAPTPPTQQAAAA